MLMVVSQIKTKLRFKYFRDLLEWKLLNFLELELFNSNETYFLLAQLYVTVLLHFG